MAKRRVPDRVPGLPTKAGFYWVTDRATREVGLLRLGRNGFWLLKNRWQHGLAVLTKYDVGGRAFEPEELKDLYCLLDELRREIILPDMSTADPDFDSLTAMGESIRRQQLHTRIDRFKKLCQEAVSPPVQGVQPDQVTGS